MNTETSTKHKSLDNTEVAASKIRKIENITNLEEASEANKLTEIDTISNEKAEENTQEFNKNEENGSNENENIANKKSVNSLSVIVKGGQENIKEIFTDCKIGYFGFLRKKSNELTGTALVSFEDDESLKALMKNGTDFNGSIIKVESLKLIDTTRFTVFARGLCPTANIDEIFQDCDLDSHKRLKEGGSKAYVYLKSEESVEKALSKNNTIVNNWILTVKRIDGKPKILISTEVYVQGLTPNTNIDDIFDDCRITSTNILRHKESNELTGNAFVIFDNEESLEKALLKDETTHDGCLIRVSRTDCNVVLYGLNAETKIEDVFEDCDIHSYEFVKDELGDYQGTIYVNFKNIESLKKALTRDRTEFGGRAMLVGMFYKPDSTLNNSLFHKSFPPKKQNNLDQRSFKKSFRRRK